MKEYIVPRGKHCYIVPYKDRALKIFDAYPINDIEQIKDLKWGDDPTGDNPKMNSYLNRASIIQNYAWWHGLAPKVYNIGYTYTNGKTYAVQETELMRGENAANMDEAMKVYLAVLKLGDKYGWQNKKQDCSMKDVVGGKLVDFNTFHFIENREEFIKNLYFEKARYGKIYYHRVPEWGINGGPRDNEARIGYMGLDKMDFKNKTVLDVGCAGGGFCRYAKDKGAKYVLGLDMADPIEAAFIVANELGYWDAVDFKVTDLKTDAYDYGQFDIVLFLSMNFHIGFPEDLFKTLRPDSTLVVEDNAKDRETNLLTDKLKDMFERIEKVGISTDHGNKINYHLTGLKV